MFLSIRCRIKSTTLSNAEKTQHSCLRIGTVQTVLAVSGLTLEEAAIDHTISTVDVMSRLMSKIILKGL